jgi:hypothetical protein
MKIYRWYSEAICMGGVIAVCKGQEDGIKQRVVEYITQTFNDVQETCADELELCVWPIEEDMDYNKQCRGVVATSY